jgi:hypothetical protein
MCKNKNNKIQNQNNFVDLEQRYVELLRVHKQLMGQDEICPDCMYTQLLSNTSQSIDLLDDLKNEIDNDQLSSESEEEIISDCKIMDTITNSNKKKKNKIIISFE